MHKCTERRAWVVSRRVGDLRSFTECISALVDANGSIQGAVDILMRRRARPAFTNASLRIARSLVRRFKGNRTALERNAIMEGVTMGMVQLAEAMAMANGGNGDPLATRQDLADRGVPLHKQTIFRYPAVGWGRLRQNPARLPR